MKPGEKYLTCATPRNEKNGVMPKRDAYVAHVGPTAVSVIVIQNAGYTKLLVPKELFAANFEPDRHAVAANRGYASPIAFAKPYL